MLSFFTHSGQRIQAQSQRPTQRPGTANPDKPGPEASPILYGGLQKDQFQRLHFGSAMPPPGPPGGGRKVFYSADDNLDIEGFNPYAGTHGEFSTDFVPLEQQQAAWENGEDAQAAGTEPAPKKKRAPKNPDSANAQRLREYRERIEQGIRLQAPRNPNSDHAKQKREGKARRMQGIRLRKPQNPDSAEARRLRNYHEKKAYAALANFDINQWFHGAETLSSKNVQWLKQNGIIEKKLSTAAAVTVIQNKLNERKEGANMIAQGLELVRQGYQMQQGHAPQQPWPDAGTSHSGYSDTNQSSEPAFSFSDSASVDQQYGYPHYSQDGVFLGYFPYPPR